MSRRMVDAFVRFCVLAGAVALACGCATAPADLSAAPTSTAPADLSVAPTSTAPADLSVAPVSTATADPSVTPVSTAASDLSVAPTSTAPADSPLAPVNTAPQVGVTGPDANDPALELAYAPGAAQVLRPGGPLDGLGIGLIANPASTIDGASTIDLFASTDRFELLWLFAPEHGVRGDLDAGQHVASGVDQATGVGVHSLYGGRKAPTAAMLEGLDALVYDLQGVGTRFYTYISTMGLAMQSAAAADVAFIVLDRPSPLGIKMSGHVLAPGFESFVGQYPIPALHGMTAGELAKAIVGEGWLDGLDTLDLRVVPMQGWSRSQTWPSLGTDWVSPSPGLPSFEAAQVYPGTVLFEGTSVSYGRGTDMVFRQIGAPWIDAEALAQELNAHDLGGVRFEPVSFAPELGSLANSPAFEGQQVHGVSFVVTDLGSFEPVAAGVAALRAVLDQAEGVGVELISRPEFFDLLAGSSELRAGLAAGATVSDLVGAWSDQVADFEALVEKYLLYPD